VSPFVLYDAAPNPFNPSTTFSFELAARGPVRLTVHDLTGRLVATLVDEIRNAGRHEALWNGRDAHQRAVASGVYVYRIEVGSYVESKRAALVK
jgi:flagellar hook assembly protein FlgD